MKTTRFVSASLSLCLLLSSVLLPQPARASHSIVENPAARIYVSTTIAPIGRFAAHGRLTINGRAVAAQGALWDGELLHAPVGSDAQAVIDGIGEVSLKGGAMVKLSASALSESTNQRQLLTASIVSGEIGVKLQPDAGAYLMAGGKSFVAGGGADFSVSMNGGQPTLRHHNRAGIVRDLGSWGLRLPALNNSANSRMDSGGENFDAASLPPFVVAPPVVLPIESATAKAASAAAPENLSWAITPNFELKSAVPVSETRRAAFLRSINVAANAAAPGKTTTAPSVRLSSNPLEGMIGMVEAPRAMKINGRLVRDREMLWDGEMIEAPADASARITLAGVGSLTLAAASTARISTAMIRTEDQSARRALVASVVSGDLIVRLQPNSAAFVSAFGNAFAADADTHFKLSAREGRAVVNVSSGLVTAIGRFVIEMSQPTMDVLRAIALAKEQSAARQYRIAAVGAGYQTIVPLRSSRELKFKVTDASGKIAAHTPVKFTLAAIDQTSGQSPIQFGNGVFNSNEFSTTTNADGIATVSLTAASASGSVAVVATIKDDAPNRATVATAVSEQGFWNARTAVPVFLTAAAIIGVGVAVAATKEDKLPIKGSDPIVIVP